MIGFACYDATGSSMFGPTSVEEAERGQGTGKALLLACLLDMRLKGYAYCAIGFGARRRTSTARRSNAVEIPNSEPGHLSRDDEAGLTSPFALQESGIEASAGWGVNER